MISVQIDILAVGKIRERYVKLGVGQFKKRLERYCRVKLVDVQDEPITGASNRVLAEEADRIRKRIKPGSYVVALDVDGKQLTSEGLAQLLSDKTLHGYSQFTFIIGGPLGLHESVLKQADCRMSLSRMTFPHELVRIFLLEQLYRAFKINRGEPYHK